MLCILELGLVLLRDGGQCNHLDLAAGAVRQNTTFGCISETLSPACIGGLPVVDDIPAIMRQILSYVDTAVTALSFSSQSGYLIFARGGRIIVKSLKDTEHASFRTVDAVDITHVAVSNDGERIATADTNGTVRAYNKEGDLRSEFRRSPESADSTAGRTVSSLAFCSSGQEKLFALDTVERVYASFNDGVVVLEPEAHSGDRYGYDIHRLWKLWARRVPASRLYNSNGYGSIYVNQSKVGSSATDRFQKDTKVTYRTFDRRHCWTSSSHEAPVSQLKFHPGSNVYASVSPHRICLRSDCWSGIQGGYFSRTVLTPKPITVVALSPGVWTETGQIAYATDDGRVFCISCHQS